MQFIAVEVFIWLIIKLCLCKRQDMSKNGNTSLFNIFGSMFGVLFCLLIKKLILGCKTISQSMRKFLWAVWSVSTFPHMDKEETFLSWKLHIDMIWIYYAFSLNLAALTFLREKVQLLPSPNDICTLFDS